MRVRRTMAERALAACLTGVMAAFGGVAPGMRPAGADARTSASSPSSAATGTVASDGVWDGGSGDSGAPADAAAGAPAVSRAALLASIGPSERLVPVVDGAVRLDVPLLAQNPELPNGCEATSLTMLLNYLSYDVTKTEIAYDYMPRGELVETPAQVLAPDPETTYIGDPGSGQGYYILAPGLVRTADRYLRAVGSPARARDLSGADEERLVAELAHGRPVVVWITIDYGDALYFRQDWTNAETGEAMTTYANLHCVLLVGFTPDAFLVNDPLRDGVQTVGRDVFLHAYHELGDRAVAVGAA